MQQQFKKGRYLFVILLGVLGIVVLTNPGAERKAIQEDEKQQSALDTFAQLPPMAQPGPWRVVQQLSGSASIVHQTGPASARLEAAHSEHSGEKALIRVYRDLEPLKRYQLTGQGAWFVRTANGQVHPQRTRLLAEERMVVVELVHGDRTTMRLHPYPDRSYLPDGNAAKLQQGLYADERFPLRLAARADAEGRLTFRFRLLDRAGIRGLSGVVERLTLTREHL